eukprot:Pgem_evm1s19435
MDLYCINLVQFTHYHDIILSVQILRNANFQSNTASNTPSYLPSTYTSTLISGQIPPTYLPLDV